MESSGSRLSIEKALKTVYDVHRKSVQDSIQNAEKFKHLYERLTEKYKKLQKDHELMSLQNRHLQEAAVGNKNRGGDCCASLRSSLETIGSTYKQLLEEKDVRIKYLEDEIKKHRRRSSALGIGSLDLTQDIPHLPSTRTSVTTNQETSPDSTSKIANCETGSHTNQANNEEEDLVFVDKSISPSHQTKLKLQKRKLKRSRYTEDISPENKRKKQSSSPKPETSPALERSKSTRDVNNAPVLVPDTCQPNLDDTLNKLEITDLKLRGNDSLRVKKISKHIEECNAGVNKGNTTPIQVVPETLAVSEDNEYLDEIDGDDKDDDHDDLTLKDTKNNSIDVLSDTDDSDSEISQATVRERSKKITDISMRSVLKNSSSQRHKPELNKSNSISSNKNGQSKFEARDFDSRNLLDSPESQKNDNSMNCEENAHTYISHKTLNLSGNSEVFELDSEDERDDSGEKTENLGGTENKGEHVGDNDEMSSRIKSKKSRKESVMEESDSILRRSPRKLKEIRYYESPKRCKKNLDDKSQLTESEIHEMFSSPNSSSNEETEVRQQQSDNAKKQSENARMQSDSARKQSDNARKRINISSDASALTDNLVDRNASINGGIPVDQTVSQSVDCFNIVPVTDGIPDRKKKIQLKVPKNTAKIGKRSEHQGSNKGTHLTVAITEDKQCSELKSPSIIASKLVYAKGNIASDIVLVSSPSSQSLTDPESPLLLQRERTGVSGSDRLTKTGDEQNSGWLKTKDKTSTKDRSFSESNRKNATNINIPDYLPSTSGNKSKDYSISTGVRKSSRVKSGKNLCQTTLTQSFLSPSKNGKKTKMKEPDLDHDLQEAIRLSLEEAQNSQEEADQLTDGDVEVLDFGTEKENSPPFKRPSVLPRSSLRRKGARHKQTPVTSVSDPDETVAPINDKQRIGDQVLREVADNDNLSEGSHHQGPRLNGSIDPAAELSALCADSNDLASLPSLDKDFRLEDLNQGRSLPKTSTLAEEDSQEIPSTSRSYKFGTKKKFKHNKTTKESGEKSQQEGRQRGTDDDHDISFDHVPKKKEPEIAHVAVVRKRDERQKLKGHSCRECYQYYKSKGLSEVEIHKQIQDCSRHRAKHVKPDTPPHFWSVGFIDTQECVDRGYMKIESKENQKKDIPTYRRRRALEKRFKAKNETSMMDSDDSDIEMSQALV